MSDHPLAQESAGVRRALEGCTAAGPCDCREHSMARRSPSGLVPSSQPSSARGSSEESSHGDSAGPQWSESYLPSMNSDALTECNWTGLGSVLTVRACDHSRLCKLYTSWGGKNTGRRYLGCPMKKAEDRCPFKEWLDAPWPERAQSVMQKLLHEVQVSRRVAADVHEQFIQSLQLNENMRESKKALEEELEKTKKAASKLCRAYAMDKSNLMVIVFCLLAVICFLVAVIIRMK